MVSYQVATVLCDGMPHEVTFAVEGDQLHVSVAHLSRTVALRGFTAQELAQIVAVELLTQQRRMPSHD